MTFASDAGVVLVIQSLNAWFFATIAGTGMALFQKIIPRTGLASGLSSNTNSVGSVLSGADIAVSAGTSIAYHGIFAVCTALLLGLAALMVLFGTWQS